MVRYYSMRRVRSNTTTNCINITVQYSVLQPITPSSESNPFPPLAAEIRREQASTAHKPSILSVGYYLFLYLFGEVVHSVFDLEPCNFGVGLDTFFSTYYLMRYYLKDLLMLKSSVITSSKTIRISGKAWLSKVPRVAPRLMAGRDIRIRS